LAYARLRLSAAQREFLKGYIEKLGELGLPPTSFDVIVSNCVINLSVDKLAVLRGAYDLLKPGGELYFADVYSDRRLSEEIKVDPLLYGECLGGALYWNDFLPMAKRLTASAPSIDFLISR
jgi:arsenite methyltransferase